MKNFLYRVLCGFFLGLSVFAPGFSGSVIAIIMGIYHDLVRIASNPLKDLKENIKFALPLGIGAAASAVLFVIFFDFLFTNYEKAAYFLFVGLITGNLPVIYNEIKKNGFKKGYLISGIAAFAAAFALGASASGMREASGLAGAAVSLPMMAISGLAAGIALFIPGMSVSMVLIIMGVYGQLIFLAESLLLRDLAYLFPFALFCFFAVIGLMLTSRGIRAIFERCPGLANTTVFGFMAGSLICVLIRSVKLSDPNFTWLLGGVMLAAGLVVSMLFVALGNKIKME